MAGQGPRLGLTAGARDAEGDLICAAPFPAMPLGFRCADGAVVAGSIGILSPTASFASTAFSSTAFARS